MKKFLVALPDDVYKALKLKSFEELRTMKAIIEQLIREYVKQEEKKP